MYNIKFESYVPEPSPATSDRIVAAHYYAAWKYGAAEVHDGFNDLHMLFGSVCALAELQLALPGIIVTEKPLKLVLDRRPFI